MTARSVAHRTSGAHGPPTHPSPIASWALAYAELGWRVFPVVAGGKRPAYRGWQRDATTDPDLIVRYWRREPEPNIGVVCGEVFDAFDIEAVHLPALRAWMLRHGHEVPDTPIARTGRGGVHILVRPTGGSGRALRLNGVHIGELKAQGGFIVVCPSRTSATYQWLRTPESGALADCPDWLRGLVAPRAKPAAQAPSQLVGLSSGAHRLASLARTVRDADEGSRNNILYWAMRRSLEEGVPATISGSVLSRMAAQAGLDQAEIAATIASAQQAAT